MRLWEVGLLGLAPGLFWLWFLHRKDKAEPEPSALLLLVFVLGGGAALLGLLLRPSLDGLLPLDPAWLRDVLDAYLVTAGGEELLKAAVLVLGVCWHRELDEPMDGVLYGAAAGLGFASVENVHYVLATGDLGLLAARSFTATLVHVACSATVGFALGLVLLDLRAGRRSAAAPRLVAGTALAVALHGTYDVFLFGFPRLWWVSLLLALPLMAGLLALKVRWSRRQSVAYHPGVRP